MFTGIIEDVGTVKHIEKQGLSGTIVVETALDMEGFSVGDSMAVDGVCLTIEKISGGTFSAHLSEETLKLTTLGELKRGRKVNIERPLTISKPLGGHIVTGHVDATGTIKGRTQRGANLDIEVEMPRRLSAQVVKKGSIAVDGISLTVAGLTGSGFRVTVIPHTLKMTTLSLKGPGERVNIETDIIGKYVERFLGSRTGGGEVTEDFLSEHGFLKER